MNNPALKKQDTTPIYIFLLLLVLLFYPPFFRGLFFQLELVPTYVATVALFLVFFFVQSKFSNKKMLESFSLVEIGLSCMVLIYIISTIFSVNMDLSIQETMKYVDYLLICMMVGRICNTKERILATLKVLVFSAVVVCLVGIGSALGTFSYNGAFTDGMINSTFQYHNTFGIYCLGMLVICYFCGSSVKSNFRYIYDAAAFILFFGFIFSFSRGAWVLLPIGAVIYYFTVSHEFKIGAIGNLVGNAAGLLVSMKAFSNVLQQESRAVGWLWFFIGLVVSVLVKFAICYVLKKINLKNKFYTITMPVILLVVFAVAFIFKNQIISFLPQNMAERFASISLGTETVTERTVFYNDAFKMIKDFPIIGGGGGAWNTMYKTYQTYAYISTQAHSYFMQVLVEVGFLGFINFIFIICAYLYYVVYTFLHCKDSFYRSLIGAGFSAVTVLLIHSAIDFDMSLSAISIILWALVGLQYSISKSATLSKNVFEFKNHFLKYGYAMVAIVFLGLSLITWSAMYASDKAQAYVESKDATNMLKYFKLSYSLNPWNPRYVQNYANILNYNASMTKDTNVWKKSIDLMDQSVQLNQYDFNILSYAATFYARNGFADKTETTINLLEKNCPLAPETYDNKASAYVAISQYYISQNQKEEAKRLLQEVANIPKQVQLLNDKIKASVKEINDLVKFVNLSPTTEANIQKANELLGTL